MYAAIDIGGTKIAAGLVDAEGELRARQERPTPSVDPVTAVEELLAALMADPRWEQVSAVGIGSAGPIDASKGTISPVNIPAWRDFPLVERVADRTGRPVTLAGDGVAMAAGEHWRGAAKGRENVLCMVVSTGVGGGLILGGRLRPGPSGNAGHVGHMCVELDGPPCPCGARGCVEIIASGRAIAARAVREGWKRPAGSATGEATAAEVAASALAGDPIALASFDLSAKALAAAIAGTAALVDIEAAVVGGGVAKSGELLFGPLREHLKEYARLSFTRDVTVHPAALGGDAGLIGAAALVGHAAI
ncbi:ROK family protein [Catenulispora acidiphila DSM 44928]|uniref:ROK family protein n=1 Tax=Catenulispora acidiphila (strain DSM 44928 / JCM 14897 / NBRC 102108 / NRRL B-24433 / ID139908) TaxID=479433 RepID=C7QJF5_CATAD|nr:ROK family protein [Catenulispora acidiphila]ACU71178.1 ROK family protein [Catenulispora acidiphila DSM 44928]